MIKKLFVLLFIFLCIGCSKDNSKNEELSVVTTIYPYYDFTRNIIGDDDNVTLLLSPGSELHSYEPTPKDIVKINNADIFIYTGGESDDWVDGVLDSIDNKDVKIIRLIDYVDVYNEELNDEVFDEVDEHIWTSPINAIKIIEVINKEISLVDKDNKEIYDNNSCKYINSLKDIDKGIREVVNNSERKTLVFGDRFPLIYFTKEYGLDYYAAFKGCSSHSEPSSKTISYLIDKIKKDNIPVVLHLELSSENISNTLSASTDTKVMEFSSIHNISKDDFDNGLTYVDIMKRNIEVLKEALN